MMTLKTALGYANEACKLVSMKVTSVSFMPQLGVWFLYASSEKTVSHALLGVDIFAVAEQLRQNETDYLPDSD